jgi:hypothetical protein
MDVGLVTGLPERLAHLIDLWGRHKIAPQRADQSPMGHSHLVFDHGRILSGDSASGRRIGQQSADV